MINIKLYILHPFNYLLVNRVKLKLATIKPRKVDYKTL